MRPPAAGAVLIGQPIAQGNAGAFSIVFLLPAAGSPTPSVPRSAVGKPRSPLSGAS